MVAEAEQPGNSMSSVARTYEVHPNQLCKWRRLIQEGALQAAITVMKMLPLWFEDYNNNHPLKGLKMLSPREFVMMQNKLERCTV